ncbi:DUF4249 domain-containing protein [Mucilaginibacter auburnensis]|uniref:Uncharacterized protein DUF4249 n=1 Tax=Mucilaginibacter auburnensis TaxID=1457233 RepID=A0A2H9VVP7_9SPHI|nr:DUF4249 domain-containing protein [Mucilaginibacter auburnensis]PJJ84891.1 uncharacterized protein DUF4249 [Mucilaginibacter auburnensis]
MMVFRFKYFKLISCVSLACLLFYACKEKYFPQTNDVNPDYLVIDGFINTGGDSTIINLSRTFKLESKAIMAVEKGATVMVENDGGASFTLTEIAAKPGSYAIPAIPQDHTKKYRLRVILKGGKQYLSDFVESKVSPPVELTYDFRHEQLNIYANTEDVSGKSKYYNYTFTETWEYQSKLKSLWKVVGREIRQRHFPEDNIFYCYHTLTSGKIVLTSTDALINDKVADFQLVNIPKNSEKIGQQYSILVKQNVLTKGGFQFLSNLKKNTESVGSIFDAQPSLLYGNIHSVSNPAEVVIGYVSAGTITQKRLTLLARDFPFHYQGNADDKYCIASLDTFWVNKGEVQKYIIDPVPPQLIPVGDSSSRGKPVWISATPEFYCVDCRLQGGTNVAPPYWIQ